MSVRRLVGWLVRWSIGRSIGPLVDNAFVSAGRDKPANDLFRVYELVIRKFSILIKSSLPYDEMIICYVSIIVIKVFIDMIRIIIAIVNVIFNVIVDLDGDDSNIPYICKNTSRLSDAIDIFR